MIEEKSYFIYILASRPRGAIYIGVTNDLENRVQEHRVGKGSKHVAKYGIYKLVHFEEFQEIDMAISREKRLKRWRRQWKDELIESHNPNWNDLYSEIAARGPGSTPELRSDLAGMTR